MPGERFTHLYLRPPERAQDSGRVRHRVGALFRDRIFTDHAQRLAPFISREIGVSLPGDGKYSSQWSEFIRESRTPDFLDAITMIYRYLFWHASEEMAVWWRNAVRQIFAEENLAYTIDDAGGVHPAIDQEFQRNIVSAIGALQSPRYQNIGQLIESVLAHLSAEPPNYKHAWRAMLSAVEGLFGLTFPYVRLSVDEIERRLLPAVLGAYEADPAAQGAARAMVNGFQSWVEASHIYRHQPGAAEVPEPAADIAILAVSYGASLVRWLASLDESRQGHTT
jgi:hypothetical protein